ncbi:hypothetical protein SteCoe_22714 [Stentor coeruleus]|uniref:Uncharacterized protein n=1 Tax=Stentor coeruleus TaxID=5963 RepID=A0A1R2BM59_9CILI|nr:hypothetical protein SteCoe_22714 [Stentor coeruleus]
MKNGSSLTETGDPLVAKIRQKYCDEHVTYDLAESVEDIFSLLKTLENTSFEAKDPRVTIDLAKLRKENNHLRKELSKFFPGKSSMESASKKLQSLLSLDEKTLHSYQDKHSRESSPGVYTNTECVSFLRYENNDLKEKNEKLLGEISSLQKKISEIELNLQSKLSSFEKMKSVSTTLRIENTNLVMQNRELGKRNKVLEEQSGIVEGLQKKLRGALIEADKGHKIIDVKEKNIQTEGEIQRSPKIINRLFEKKCNGLNVDYQMNIYCKAVKKYVLKVHKGEKIGFWAEKNVVKVKKDKEDKKIFEIDVQNSLGVKCCIEKKKNKEKKEVKGEKKEKINLRIQKIENLKVLGVEKVQKVLENERKKPDLKIHNSFAVGIHGIKTPIKIADDSGRLNPLPLPLPKPITKPKPKLSTHSFSSANIKGEKPIRKKFEIESQNNLSIKSLSKTKKNKTGTCKVELQPPVSIKVSKRLAEKRKRKGLKEVTILSIDILGTKKKPQMLKSSKVHNESYIPDPKKNLKTLKPNLKNSKPVALLIKSTPKAKPKLAVIKSQTLSLTPQHWQITLSKINVFNRTESEEFEVFNAKNLYKPELSLSLPSSTSFTPKPHPLSIDPGPQLLCKKKPIRLRVKMFQIFKSPIQTFNLSVYRGISKTRSLEIVILRKFSYKPESNKTDDDDAKSTSSNNARRKNRQPVRKPALEEYFNLTFQTVKMNFQDRDKIQGLNSDELFIRANQSGIAFNMYHDWMKEQFIMFANTAARKPSVMVKGK